MPLCALENHFQTCFRNLRVDVEGKDNSDTEDCCVLSVSHYPTIVCSLSLTGEGPFGWSDLPPALLGHIV